MNEGWCGWGEDCGEGWAEARSYKTWSSKLTDLGPYSKNNEKPMDCVKQEHSAIQFVSVFWKGPSHGTEQSQPRRMLLNNLEGYCNHPGKR